jgi:hypothetical protein
MAIDQTPDLDGADDQDIAETLDEETLGIESNRRETFEELPDVLDVTSAEGDADDDAALIGEDLDDDEIIALEEDQPLADPEDDDLATRDDDIPDSAAPTSGGAPRRRYD